MDNQAEQLQRLARDVLVLSRNTLLVNLRFLDMALSQFTYHEIEDNTLLTDGKYLLYDPKHILRCYKSAKECCFMTFSLCRDGRFRQKSKSA